jgi:hypothetical protein
MFGHDKEDKKEDSNVIHPISSTPVDEKLLGVDDNSSSKDDTTNDSSDDTTSTDDNQDKDINDIVENINASTDATDTPSSDSDDDDKTTSDDPIVPASDSDDSKPTESVDFSAPSDSSPAPSSELMDIKRSALEELSPLIDKLDQTPEEKTMTLLMMIQATDDQSLIGAVFNAAKDIKDDKKRAQAMLDIVNEINYFTKKSN